MLKDAEKAVVEMNFAEVEVEFTEVDTVDMRDMVEEVEVDVDVVVVDVEVDAEVKRPILAST